MFNIISRQIEWEGRILTLETGKVARQADGAVFITYGETQVLCTVVAQKKPKEGINFFPLTVIYQEKAFAAGKIPGGFFKREGRPSEKEVLTSRLIDRPIRPLFSNHFYNETQVICTVVSHDLENDPDIVAMIGTSAALAIAGLPFHGPIAGARVGYIDGQYIVNPTLAQMESTKLDLVVAGTADSVMMVESEAQELSEEIMLGAVEHGHKSMQPIIDLIQDFASAVKPVVWAAEPTEVDDLYQAVRVMAEAKLRAAYQESSKAARRDLLAAVEQEIVSHFTTVGHLDTTVLGQLKELEKDIVRRNIVETGTRIDGRDHRTVRPIIAEVDVLTRAHGSALFTRGETQALVVTTLGTTQDEQIIDSLERSDGREHFMLHYNFPPYSVGEASPMRAPGRREIGHGKLAWRALRALLPNKVDFPYTLRLVSEITESNGSSSMATVCGASLSMMDAGVPLAAPVAGIAMGLIKEHDKYVVLSDILGDEDHLGDMDFKVAGTAAGVTALQMDIKIRGITHEIMKIALDQANEGRLHILGEMSKALTASRSSISKNAPTITTMVIPKDKIREVIGTGGKVIREICELSGAKVDIEDDGTVRVAAVSGEASAKAIAMIQNIVAEPEAGVVYAGTVVKIMQFGAFVNFLGARDGLVHISELTDSRVEKVEDIVSEGQTVKVLMMGMDNRGKCRLSMRFVNQETGELLISAEELAALNEAESANNGGGGNGREERRGGRREGGRSEGKKSEGGRREGNSSEESHTEEGGRRSSRNDRERPAREPRAEAPASTDDSSKSKRKYFQA